MSARHHRGLPALGNILELLLATIREAESRTHHRVADGEEERTSPASGRPAVGRRPGYMTESTCQWPGTPLRSW